MTKKKTEIYQLKYLTTPDFIFKDRRLSGLQIKVLSFIYTYSGKEFFFSNTRIAEMFGASRGSISRVIGQLETYKYIRLRYVKTKEGNKKRFVERIYKRGDSKWLRGDSNRLRGVIPVGVHKDNNKKDNILIKEIWDFYISTANTKEKFLLSRKEKIAVRLKVFTKDEIKQAIVNCFNSPFHTGKNDRGWIANANYIFNSDKNLDNLLSLRVKDNRSYDQKLIDEMLPKDNG